MVNLLRKPTDQQVPDNEGRFSRFHLTENPFPAEPIVNKDSSDRRINGGIYASEIRTKEYDLLEKAFLKTPQSERNRLRLGYICDTSYIGRGNGKSAFIVNLMQRINEECCLNISDGINKCFAVYVDSEPGGAGYACIHGGYAHPRTSGWLVWALVSQTLPSPGRG